MLTDIIYLIGGLLILLFSGKYLVKGGAALANYFKVSKLVIGVTVVSFGTSAPELLVSLQAAFNGHADIAMGNIIGSNISNIALVLAISAIIYPIPVKSNSIKIDWPVMMGAGLILLLFSANAKLEFYEGLVFLLGLSAFIFLTIKKSRKQFLEVEELEEGLPKNIWVSIGLVLISCVGLAFGSNWLVKGAVGMAEAFHVSERVISITMIAFGTSVPELVTSGIAAFKKETDISIGNIIGSNIFNTFGVLGITGMVHPIAISQEMAQVDMYWMLGIFLALFIFILPLKGGVLRRWKGAGLLIIYAVYLYFLIRK